MSWLQLVLAALDFVRDECKRADNCRSCRLSDAKGECPFLIEHDGAPVPFYPSVWRLEEVSDVKEPRFEA